jgi:hypothetical protein
VTSAYQVPEDDWVKAVSHFVVGGVSQTIGAWVSGDVGLNQAQLIDQLTRILDGLSARELDRR